MVELNQSNFKQTVKDNSLIIVDFYATWCNPCRMLKPIMERVEDKREDVKFFAVDISANEDIAKEYRIFSVPTLVAFKDGKVLDSLVGLNSYDTILDFIEKCEKQ